MDLQDKYTYYEKNKLAVLNLNNFKTFNWVFDKNKMCAHGIKTFFINNCM